MKKKIRNILMHIIGFLLLIIGCTGIFIPVLPATPFILSAVGCFSVNPKIKNFLLKFKYIRDHVENYKNRTGLPLKNLIFSLLFLWITLIISMVLVNKIWVYGLLCAIGAAVMIHLIMIAKPKKNKKTRRKNERSNTVT